VRRAGAGKNLRQLGNFPSSLSVLTGNWANPERRIVNVIEFFEYLAASEQTRELAFELADAWAAHELEDVHAPAA
jgi:hypothetical protein